MIKIAVASGKGGTGKTFVATNMFNALLKNGESCHLVDCDAEAPNSVAFFDVTESRRTVVTQPVPQIDTSKCTYCGLCHDYCSYNAVFILPHISFIQVITDLCHGCGACTVACSHDAIAEKDVSLGEVISWNLKGEHRITEASMNAGVMSPVSIIKKAIRETDDISGTVILDAPPGTSCPFIQTVSRADYTILVTEPTPFGLSDLVQSAETLKSIEKPFGVIINRSGTGNRDVYEYLEKEKIDLLLEIPYSKKTAGLYSEGKLVSDTDIGFREQLRKTAMTITAGYGNSSDKR